MLHSQKKSQRIKLLLIPYQARFYLKLLTDPSLDYGLGTMTATTWKLCSIYVHVYRKTRIKTCIKI